MVDEAQVLPPRQTVVISRPEDMARLLRESCPEKATAFAFGAHERACWDYDESRTLFWEHVINALAQEGQSVQQAAA